MNKIFEQLLQRRKIDSDFLNPVYEKSANPNELKEMDIAVARIKRAVKTQETVLIFGDYDADGVTATVVMHDALKLAGVKKIEMMLPDRFEDGYGMSEKVIERAKEVGAGLVITVDCGSANGEIIDKLIELKIDTIVTDHHECPEVLPDAMAVINPKRADNENEDLKNLAGVGVAFMVARALVMDGAIPEGQEKWMLDMVVIGTLCDSMKVTGENRRLCYWGMKVLEKTRRPGLKELIRVADIKKLDSESIGFRIGPRINAAGRMKSANIALELMMTRSRVRAANLAKQLSFLNEQRRQMQMKVVEEIKKASELSDKVLVVSGDYHEGILGIVAGRLCEDYERPAFAFRLMKEDGVYKGSGRSFGDFNLKDALDACRDAIVGGGGHAGACGIRVSEDKLDEFRERINEYYKSLHLVNQEKYLVREADVETDELDWFDLEFMEDLSRLEPFGEGNLEPIFGLREVRVLNKTFMGKNNEHLKLLLKGSDDRLFKVMAFYAPNDWTNVENGDIVDIDMTVLTNEWNGTKNVEGRIVKMRLADNRDI